MDIKARKDIQRVEKKIHWKTSTNKTGLGRKMKIEVNISDYTIKYENGQ